jgi:hypothetical protein
MEHDRARPAVVRVQVKSTRIGRPGHPMVRERSLCLAHAKQLRELGFDVVASS